MIILFIILMAPLALFSGIRLLQYVTSKKIRRDMRYVSRYLRLVYMIPFSIVYGITSMLWDLGKTFMRMFLYIMAVFACFVAIMYVYFSIVQ